MNIHMRLFFKQPVHGQRQHEIMGGVSSLVTSITGVQPRNQLAGEDALQRDCVRAARSTRRAQELGRASGAGNCSKQSEYGCSPCFQ